MAEIVSCGTTDEERHQTFRTSIGRTDREIRSALTALPADASTCCRLTLPGFPRTCLMYGHVVWQYLPGVICKRLRANAGCAFAEVLRVLHPADPTIVAVFDSDGALDSATAALSDTTFQLEHLTLDCPRIETERCSLDCVIRNVDSGGSPVLAGQ